MEEENERFFSWRFESVKVFAVSFGVGVLLHLTSHSYLYAESTMQQLRNAVIAKIAHKFGYRKPGHKQVEREFSIEDKIELEAVVNGIHPDLIKAMIKQESHRNPWATSHVGAKGLMQLMPATAKACGLESAGEAYVPFKNIECGVYWARKNIEQQGGDLFRGLESYNGGPKCVGRKCKESTEYAETVLRFFYTRDLS